MASDDLRARLVAAFREAGRLCDEDCEDEAACDAAHPVQATRLTFDQVTHVGGPVEALADVAVTVLQGELDRLTAERDHLASACRTVRRRLVVLYAALPPGLEFYLGKIKAMGQFLANAVADIPPTSGEADHVG